MTLKSGLLNASSILADARSETARLYERSLEDVLEGYIKLLLACALLAALTTLTVTVAKAAYYDIVQHVSVEYLRLLNYGLGISAGTFFAYLFIGTVGIGLLGLLLRSFVKTSYPHLMKLLCASLAPVLLFGWISIRIALVLLLWSLVLTAIGLRVKAPAAKRRAKR